MKLIPVLFLFLALAGCFKGLSVEAYFDESCQMNPELEQECSVYAHQVTKPMLGYFEQVTQKIDKHSEEIERKNEQIKHLEESEMRLKKELDIKHEQIKQLQLENLNYKLKETGILEDLKQTMEQLPNKLCDYQNNELKEFQAMQIELQEELESKNELIEQLQIEISTYKSKGEENLKSEKEKLTTLETKNSLNAKKLSSCESELVAKDIKVNQLEAELKKCDEILDKIRKKNANSCITKYSSGVHIVTLFNNDSFEVLCNSDIAGPGWTVIQQRINGNVNFYVNWDLYRDGFGDFWNGDFFLGLENIYRLTTEQRHELYIHMERFDNSTYYARYDDFAISGETNNYTLSRLGHFSGNTTDQLRPHQNMAFRTRDKDTSDGTAEYFHGGWWYYYSASCNLNGQYFKSGVQHKQSVFWENVTSLKQVKMMIRPRY